MAEEIIRKSVNACIKCGTREITINDCGYTTFNPGWAGWAKCIGCGKKVTVSVCGNPPKTSIIKKWNEKNPKPQTVIARLDKMSDAVRCPKCGYVYWSRAYENWATCDNCGSNNDRIPIEAIDQPMLVNSDLIFTVIPKPELKKPQRKFNRYTALTEDEK